MKPSSSMAEIQSLLGYTFRDPLLLEEALTHGSHSSRPDYQRLEFLGDAVLGLAVTIFLYRSNPSLGSGKLTLLRSDNVSTEKLARACVRHNLYRFLRRNDPVLDRLVFKFENSVRKELEYETEVSYGGSSRKAPKILADIVESTAAAIYIDSKFNLDVVWKVFGKILEPIIKNINEHLMNDSATVVTMKSSSSTADSRSLFGYTFHDPLLLEEALTHGSHSSCLTYQRLEFVGDAVLGLAVTRFLYNSNPSLGSEELTLLRSANVSTEKLARACVRHNLYRLLRRNDRVTRVLDQLVFEFENSVREELEDETAVSYGGSSCKAPKILADIVESTAAAVYIDSKYNLDVVWEVFEKILKPIIKNRNEHPMTILKELMEKQHQKIMTKDSLENSLPTVEIFVVGDLLGKGSARNKKIATLKAARNALQKLHPLQGANLDTEAEDGAAGELDSPQQRQNDFSTAKEFAIFFFFVVLIVLLVQHVSPDEATEI